MRLAVAIDGLKELIAKLVYTLNKYNNIILVIHIVVNTDRAYISIYL